MNIVVAGGTGFLGREITGALLDAGHAVTVASRSNPTKRPIDARAKWVAGDVTSVASLTTAVTGADLVVDAVQFPNSPIENPKKGYTYEKIDLGGTRNLVDATKAAGVPEFIGLSGVGVAADAPYHWLRFKWQEEQYIIASGLSYTIFRPSWVYGPGDISLNRFLGFAKMLPFIPVIGNGKTKISPLYVHDLAVHVAAAVDRPSARGKIFEIGGPHVLTMNEVIRIALKVAGKKRFLLHNPAGMMKLVAGVIQHAPGRPLTPDAIDFIMQDGVADTRSLQEEFKLPLTPLAQGLANYVGK